MTHARAAALLTRAPRFRSMTLLLLADHPAVQQKLRSEILDAFRSGSDSDNGPREGFDHDTLVSLPYLDAVCRETLRLYVGMHAPVAKSCH